MQRVRIFAGCATLALVVGMLTGTLGSAATAQPVTRSGAVPAHFRANSLTWITPERGWVLGTAPCGSKKCTDVIATTDGGATWSLRGTVPTKIPRVGEPGTGVSQVRFGTARVGWSFGPRLYRTGNGGRVWTRLPVPGGGKQVLDLATTATATYALVSPCAYGTGLCRHRGPLSLWRSATRTERAWTRVAVKLPINDFGNVAAYGKTAYVVDGQRDVNGHRDRFYASTDNGRHFSARRVPCDSHPGSALWQAVATSSTRVALVCWGPTGPQPGQATKRVYRSSDTGETYTFAGLTPVSGAAPQTIHLAASPSGNLAVTASSGASYIYINDGPGRSWDTPVALGDGGRGWGDIQYASNSAGWAVYSPVGFFNGLGKVFATHDAGHHWHAITL